MLVDKDYTNVIVSFNSRIREYFEVFAYDYLIEALRYCVPPSIFFAEYSCFEQRGKIFLFVAGYAWIIITISEVGCCVPELSLINSLST